MFTTSNSSLLAGMCHPFTHDPTPPSDKLLTFIAQLVELFVVNEWGEWRLSADRIAV